MFSFSPQQFAKLITREEEQGSNLAPDEAINTKNISVKNKNQTQKNNKSKINLDKYSGYDDVNNFYKAMEKKHSFSEIGKPSRYYSKLFINDLY